MVVAAAVVVVVVVMGVIMYNPVQYEGPFSQLELSLGALQLFPRHFLERVRVV